MICYSGSKRRIIRDILPILLTDREEGQWYVEPFAGGCNAIEHVPGPRIANDSNQYVMAMFQRVRDGWIPPSDVTEELYNEVRLNPAAYDPALVGFLGTGCSYGGKWFGGYARSTGKHGERRNNAAEAQRNILKQITRLSDVVFVSYDYRLLPVPESSILYCDPPYQATVGYKDTFDHEVFWEWVREQSLHHRVYVSEYTAPEDFTCVWEKERSSTMRQQQGTIHTERLFVYTNTEKK